MSMNPICLNEHQTRELLRLLREGALGTGPGPAMYLSHRDLISLLHASPRTVARWRAEGRIPYLKIGKKLFYPADFLLQKEESPLPSPSADYKGRPPPIEPSEPLRVEHLPCEQCPLYLLLVE